MQRTYGFAVLGVIAGVWVVLGAVDWVMRFAWFRWHERIISVHIAPETGNFPRLGVFTNPAVRGGDLTTLLGKGRAAEVYKETKPAATNWSDEYGFRNIPPTTNRYYPVVVVGDSFMLAGPRMEDTFAGMLQAKIGVPVYNYGVDGRGPLWPMARFLASKRFLARPPRVVVWGLLERSLHSMAVSDPTDADLVPPPHGWPFRRGAFSPEALKRSLPDTSATAQVMSRLWTTVRGLFPLLQQAVVVEAPEVKMLFYRPAIRSERRPLDSESLNRIVRMVALVDDICRQRHMQLVILLIPDKERVYRAWIPRNAVTSPPDTGNPSNLMYVEACLREASIDVVNLLPLFEEAAAQGGLLYWRDDTHWNPVGVELAVQSVADDILQHITERVADAL